MESAQPLPPLPRGTCARDNEAIGFVPKDQIDEFVSSIGEKAPASGEIFVATI